MRINFSKFNSGRISDLMRTWRKYLFLTIVYSICHSIFPQALFYKTSSFYIPNQGPFIETSITISGNNLKRVYSKDGFKSAASIGFLVQNEKGEIVIANKYNVEGPIYKDTTIIPAFIDQQRYPLKNGTYTLELTVQDKYDVQTEPSKMKQKFVLNYSRDSINSSTIQLLESFSKSKKLGPLSKSGYDLVPYNLNWYPEEMSKLQFYFESYNCDTILGLNQPIIYNYYVENTETKEVANGLAGFQKQKCAKVNPIIGQFDITKLPSGNYNLVVEVKDKLNKIVLSEKVFFQRKNTQIDSTIIANYAIPNALEKYFHSVNSLDTLKIFVECLWPISNMKDRERQTNVSLKGDTSLIRKYLIQYWTDMAADTISPMKLWMTYLTSVNEAEALFKCGKQKGYFTDRGRVYLQYGPPNQRSVQASEPNTYPYEIWQYYRIHDKTNGQFFTNRKFVFVNKNIADNCHRLEHSNMKGEINNERWRYEVMKHITDGIGNPDNNSPSNMGNNQVDDLFNNPR
ncbi:MAG: GWxTD domain-containing protein [Bacteroidia bacterium]